jgi:hypothetical protein
MAVKGWVEAVRAGGCAGACFAEVFGGGCLSLPEGVERCRERFLWLAELNH